MRSDPDVEFIVLASSDGAYVALPVQVFDEFGVSEGARDAVDELVRLGRAQSSEKPTWGFYGRFIKRAERRGAE